MTESPHPAINPSWAYIEAEGWLIDRKAFPSAIEGGGGEEEEEGVYYTSAVYMHLLLTVFISLLLLPLSFLLFQQRAFFSFVQTDYISIFFFIYSKYFSRETGNIFIH